jgi:tripeptidyl-peptidase I
MLRAILESLDSAEFAKNPVVGRSRNNTTMSSMLMCLCFDDHTDSLDSKRFNPVFPGSCPFVLSIGATQINSGATVNDPESACEREIFSGGGFSDIFQMPSYQTAAVTKFLKTHPPPYSAAQFNNSGKVELMIQLYLG